MDGNFFDAGVEIAVILDVLAVPVNQTTGPFDRAFTVTGQATRPERYLYAGRRLWILVSIGGFIVGVGTFPGPANLAIDRPRDLVGGPVDGVGVIIAEGVRERDVLAMFICYIP